MSSGLSRLRRATIMAASALLLCIAPVARAQDDAPARIRPYPGSRLVEKSTKELEEYWLPVGKLYGNGQAEKVLTIDGKWLHFAYANPEGRSVLEIFTSYEDTLRANGFEIVYSCKDAECGQGGRKTNGDWWDPNHLRRFLVAKLPQPEGDLWVSIHVHAKQTNAPGTHEIDLIESRQSSSPAVAEPSHPTASTLYQELTRSGHAAVYGISWDAKGEPTMDSDPALRAIADLVANYPKLQLYVVVHTDNVGGFQANVERSRREAVTLANLLSRKYRVPAARIRASGMGPLAPLAANDTDEGRTKNRRVELVRP